jgi:hypothetical protein
MSDTSPRNPAAAQQMLADALLRSVGGVSAQLVVTSTSTDTTMSEMGLVATNFGSVIVSPVVMRKLRPTWQEGNQSKWELLISASSIGVQVGALNLASAQELFAMTLSVIVAEQSYLIESIASNEVFGQIYLYRLLLREQLQQAV